MALVKFAGSASLQESCQRAHAHHRSPNQQAGHHQQTHPSMTGLAHQKLLRGQHENGVCPHQKRVVTVWRGGRPGDSFGEYNEHPRVALLRRSAQVVAQQLCAKLLLGQHCRARVLTLLEVP